MLAHGTVRSLREVCDNVGSMDGQSVRVMGFLQEFDPGEGMGGIPLLRARVARNVDGLDQETYKRALQVRRKFLSGK